MSHVMSMLSRRRNQTSALGGAGLRWTWCHWFIDSLRNATNWFNLIQLMPWHWESGEFDVCKCPNQATVKQAAQGPHDHRFHLTPVNPVNAMFNTMVILVANNALQCTSFTFLTSSIAVFTTICKCIKETHQHNIPTVYIQSQIVLGTATTSLRAAWRSSRACACPLDGRTDKPTSTKGLEFWQALGLWQSCCSHTRWFFILTWTCQCRRGMSSVHANIGSFGFHYKWWEHLPACYMLHVHFLLVIT